MRDRRPSPESSRRDAAGADKSAQPRERQDGLGFGREPLVLEHERSVLRNGCFNSTLSPLDLSTAQRKKELLALIDDDAALCGRV